MKKKNEIPEYVLSGNKNIPKDLKVVKYYFENCGNKNYQLCLVVILSEVTSDFTVSFAKHTPLTVLKYSSSPNF
jgi:hypothetical protein